MDKKEIELIVCFANGTWNYRKEFISFPLWDRHDRDEVEAYLLPILEVEYAQLAREQPDRKDRFSIVAIMVCWWGPEVLPKK